MSVPAALVEIQRPCPVDLPEDFRGGAQNRHCGHCQKTVHLLSSLTEAEAKTFLDESAGRDVCVTYLIDAAGNILFRPEPTIVPVSALRPRRMGLAAAAGLGLALAACAPHDNPRVEAQVTQTPIQEPCDGKPVPTTNDVVEHTMVAGGIGPMEPGPIEPPKVEPPKVEPPRMLAGKPVARPPQMVRGGRG